MREVPRRPTDATANIENTALFRNCDPLSLIPSGGQAARMEMLKRSKDFRVQILWVVSQLSQRGVDPRKHTRSRPMRLNIRWFGHGVPCPAFKECTLETRLRKLRFQKWAWMVVA